MGSPVVFPHSGGGGVALTPLQAKRYFEFFAAGTHREVLLLGELVEQPVHYVKSKGHKVLCSSPAGACELCDRAATDGDVSTQQAEYLAPSFVRQQREKEFHQRVAVFSQAAGLEVFRLLAGSPHRGVRLDVERYARGTSSRAKVKILSGLPRGFPDAIPPAFDLVPFVRARFGKRQDPARPMVLLPGFKCDPTGIVGRPASLGLSAEDYVPSADERAKMRAKLKPALAIDDAPTPAAGPPAAPAAAASRPDDPAAAEDLFPRLIDGVNARLGPKTVARAAATPEGDELALRKGTGSIVCHEVKGSAPLFKHLNGQHAAGGNGGAK